VLWLRIIMFLASIAVAAQSTWPVPAKSAVRLTVCHTRVLSQTAPLAVLHPRAANARTRTPSHAASRCEGV
jgi:hypothetical protein